MWRWSFRYNLEKDILRSLKSNVSVNLYLVFSPEDLYPPLLPSRPEPSTVMGPDQPLFIRFQLELCQIMGIVQ